MSYLNKDVWSKTAQGFVFTDCAVRSKDVACFCLRKNLPNEEASLMWDHDIETRLLQILLAPPPDVDIPVGCRFLTGYNKPKIGVARSPVAQSLLVARNIDGQVSVMGGGKKFPDEFIAPEQNPTTQRIKCINGYAYSVGDRRKIYKRTDIGKWERFADLPRGEGGVATVGFNDMDAFSESDMYAVGGHGDIWHFDGKEWIQMGFPSNVELATVTCAGDGKVYISGEGGSLWRGRESTWERIYKGNSTILWNDAVWFEDKLWLASDYQFRIWDGKELVHVTHKGEPVPIYGHMDAYDGLLVVASPEVVMAYDGNDWQILVAPYPDEDE
jgi:hypothetical protein